MRVQHGQGNRLPVITAELDYTSGEDLPFVIGQVTRVDFFVVSATETLIEEQVDASDFSMPTAKILRATYRPSTAYAALPVGKHRGFFRATIGTSEVDFPNSRERIVVEITPPEPT